MERDIKQLGEQLKPYLYVVQRNWDNLPRSFGVNGHEDLDLFTSDGDKEAVLEIVQDWELIDVRSPSDLYYPADIGRAMLWDRREYNGFYIPSKMAHFLSLYYHNEFHKKNDPYKSKLKSIFADWQPPVRCVDEGVGYYP